MKKKKKKCSCQHPIGHPCNLRSCWCEKHMKIDELYPEAYRLAKRFHEFYEQSAPAFGYKTKEETKEFDPESPNGRLMAWVCFQIVKEEKQKVLKDICPHPRKLLGSVEKNDVWREGYNKCLWDIKQRINKLDIFEEEV
jgi:hypothetical protein